MVTSVVGPTAVGPPPPPLSAFYSRFLSEEDRAAYEVALTIDGLQGEIALLRVQLGHVCQDDPDNTPMFLRLTNAINRLTKTQQALKKDAAVQTVGTAKSLFESLFPEESASGPDTRHEANRQPHGGADPCVRPGDMDFRPDRESMTVEANVDPALSVQSEPSGTGEPLVADDSAPLSSDQGTAVQPPMTFSTMAASLLGNQDKPRFQHGNGRSKKKSKKNHHSR